MITYRKNFCPSMAMKRGNNGFDDGPKRKRGNPGDERIRFLVNSKVLACFSAELFFI